MFQYEVVGDDHRPAIWASIVLIVIGMLGCFISTAFSPLGVNVTAPNPTGLTVLRAAAALVADVVGPVWLLWRHRQPFVITLATAAISLILPIGNIVPLIALACLLSRRRGTASWWAVAAVTVTTSVVRVLDATNSPAAASVIKSVAAPANTPGTADQTVSWLVVASFIILGLVISIGSGLWRRTQRAAKSLARERDVARATNAKLGDELSRREERERIAQEIHDQLGHRLSLLSLQSGALETQLQDNPDAVRAAHEVRSGAAAAVNDLHSLLSMICEPQGAPDLPLSKLAEVIDESFRASQPLNSNVFIEDADRADPAVSRAVYRIVQELLTNAAKHAPGQTTTLRIRGNPHDGISIDATNGYTGGWTGGPGPDSRGLKGITERVELLGGSLHYGLDDGLFHVHVEIPWR
ncbi:sensor histidine kinase [Cutibacterium sp.]|uniref:sensor histidine kinase n=1 Tax=Cutibacterium sp. TaxID=1912221 RepID=UPI0026DDC96E|nr:histidine kinase [Cutibacterium sp.]MDO4412785.1 histidine kinase [Cutibacterium sp.]